MNDCLEQTRRRWYRHPVFIGIVALSIPVIGSIIFIEMRSYVQYTEALARNRELDPLLTHAEIVAALPPIPDDQNGALVVLSIQDRMDEIADLGLFTGAPIFDEDPMPPLGERIDEATWVKASVLLEEAADEIAILDRLKDYTDGRYEVEITENPYDMPFLHLAPLRAVAKLKSLDAIRHAYEGDTDNVLLDLETIATMGRLTDDEASLLSALVSIAIDAYCIDSLMETLALTEFSHDQLIQAECILERIYAPERLYHGVRGDRATTIQLISLLRNNPSVLGETSVQTWLEMNAPVIHARRMRDFAYSLNGWVPLLQAARLNAVDTATWTRLRTYTDNTPEQYILSFLILPSLSRSFELSARGEAQRRAAVVGVALERYRLDHHDWPETLDALTPMYIDTIPADPFADAPLQYVINKNCVVVYSIGDDRINDNGDVTHARITDPQEAPDWGFVLLNPDQRNRPAATTQPTAQPVTE